MRLRGCPRKRSRGLAEFVPGGGAAFDIAKSTFDKYRERCRQHQVDQNIEQKMREGIEQIALASVAEVKHAAAAIAKKAADPEIRSVVQIFLEQIPGAVHQSLKRADDPTGRSVPADFTLRSAEDVARLLPPTLPRFKPGDALPGRSGWVLDRHISGGGFGEVWLARQVSDGDCRAVKFCKSLQNPDRDLRHEASVISRLIGQGKNANVVPLLDAHLDGEVPWLMYEYVEGGDVGDMIRHWTRLPPAERQQKVVNALQLLAKAVGRFHRLSPPIIHRDLKPANILYDKKQKQLRITDFGIGGIAAREMIDGAKRGTLTSAGRLQSYLYGSYTPLYASTQQKAGAPPDPRDDVHALGVIAYQMLTCQMTQGVGPDFAHDLQELAVEPGLIDLVGRCAAQRADRRPKDAGEISEVLAKLRAKAQVQTLTPVEPTMPVKKAAAPPVAKALAPNTPSPKAPSDVVMNPVAGKPKNKSTTPGMSSNPKPKVDPFHEVDLAVLRDLDELGLADITLDMTPTQASAAAMVMPPQTSVKPPLQTAKLVKRATESAAERGRIMTNALGMKFAWVPPGKSWLGGGGGNPGTTPFNLQQGLWCGSYPVTQAEWYEVMKTPPPVEQAEWHEVIKTIPSHFNNPRYPVESVSWIDVHKFLEKLNACGDDYVYRLPTEQEWEYICRGGPITQDQSKFCYYFAKSTTDWTPRPTNDLSSKDANFDGNHPAGSASKGPYLQRPIDVGSYLPNPLGIYDMHGNVWEWTDSFWEAGHSDQRVVRGGCWFHIAEYCAAVYRNKFRPGDSYNYVGFRLLAVPRGE